MKQTLESVLGNLLDDGDVQEKTSCDIEKFMHADMSSPKEGLSRPDGEENSEGYDVFLQRYFKTSDDDKPPQPQNISLATPSKRFHQQFKEDYLTLSQDQSGSRVVQHKIETSTSDRDAIFDGIEAEAVHLSKDVFANYVIQKLFEFGTVWQKSQLTKRLTGCFVELSLHMYGCRVVQKAIEFVDDIDKRTIFNEIEENIVACIQDQNGNHVIQKCVEKGDTRIIDAIISAFQGRVLAFSQHPYGCRVIQRILEKIPTEKSYPLLQEILPNTLELSKDQYGNYVIQYIVERCPTERTKIRRALQGSIAELSMQKYSSNVIEKCFMCANAKGRQEMLKEIYGTKREGTPLLMMMRDQYANYVVQKIIENVSDTEREFMVNNVVLPQISSLRKVPYAKHILVLLQNYGVDV
ncbi:pumilio domain containing protein C6G9.14, putative [Entamoeba invadens IP1]|uniref:Pumilio domain containing protein C6G9.14, putative n=1 Tax=Entamoeba invadens IP1 TaxID=370355 RepID=A0A0A1UEF2_ENTIV|nr:pumilio domain containing protein C6G9.14, putative [Entamoeba invadens IP1]ELP92171.1 pumilio domain containing protein C6G9.14, putative [Entamoeba invadens IP1]|eukprot:XP_004258942.1 pumilio domain containing protein C6G9.14, putative [Entamoeba invadens IP1]